MPLVLSMQEVQLVNSFIQDLVARRGMPVLPDCAFHEVAYPVTDVSLPALIDDSSTFSHSVVKTLDVALLGAPSPISKDADNTLDDALSDVPRNILQSSGKALDVALLGAPSL